jgi:hypothetical protein
MRKRGKKGEESVRKGREWKGKKKERKGEKEVEKRKSKVRKQKNTTLQHNGSDPEDKHPNVWIPHCHHLEVMYKTVNSMTLVSSSYNAHNSIFLTRIL